ncbi:MAG: zinc-ribbon domain-containing protein [bacterium]
MICWQCAKENKDTAKICKKCGIDLRLPVIWKPSWKWHAKTLLIIYITLILTYIVGIGLIKKLKPPYNQREIPQEMTPWLKP